MADITAIILTKNEEKNIEECIRSIKNVVKRVVVVDSYSEDNTISLAEKLGAEILQHTFESHAKQFMYAVDAAKVDTTWVLRIDADERLTIESAEELEEICNKNMNSDVSGVVLRFKKNFLGRDLYHGGVYPWKKLSCYKTQYGFVEDRLMDEHIVLREGSYIEMRNDCLHFDFKSLEHFVNKHNWYSSRETIDYFKYKNQTNHSNANIKTKFKMNVYYKLPGGLRAYIYYIYRYYFRLGFLDGKEGKIYSFLQAYWYRFLVDAKIYECEKMGTMYQIDQE